MIGLMLDVAGVSTLKMLEAEKVDDDYSEKVLLVKFLRLVKKAKPEFISTHNGVDNAFNTYIQDAREGRKDYSIHRITLDDAIAEGLYQRICYVTGQEWSLEAQLEWRAKLYKNAPNTESAEEEYGCVPKKSGGAYLSRVLIEQAMVGSLHPHLPLRGAGRLYPAAAADLRPVFDPVDRG